MNTEIQPSSLSDKLKALRIQRNMSQTDVARYLCLNENIIERIESSLDESMFNNVFYRGYIRSYAKLLNYPEHELNRYLGDAPKATPIIAEQTQAEVIDERPNYQKDNSGFLKNVDMNMLKDRLSLLNKKRLYIILAVLFLCIILVVLIKSIGGNKTPEPLPLDTVVQSGMLPVVQDDDESENLNLPEVSDTETNAVDDEDASGNDALGDFIKQSLSNADPVDSTSISTETSSVENPTELVLPTNGTSVTSNAVQTSVKQTNKKPLLAITVKKNCWIKVVNKDTKKVLYAGTKKAGETLTYQLPIAYDISIGNLSNVVIVFNNKPVKLTSYARKNNSAFLSLDAKNLH